MKPTSKLHGFNYDQQQKININGPRPTPLMIRKPNSSHKQQRVPIIIYTQSPKIIHTKAQDFMALVQRLTGMTTTNQALPRQQEVSENFDSSLSDGSNNNSINYKHLDGDHETTSTTSSVDKGGVNSNIDYEQSPNNMMKFAEMPLFTPTSYDFFSPNNSSRPVYKFSDSPYGILGSLISPSALGFIQDLPEY
ncbi:VQ motif-containing protein 8, chloroplastic-like [Vicia villosa]|uniref:VQ motif-containing protein 8, chloroplastic-like n=1 Tax=Vicia villosa TaxID=3911 RepID=UPI00273CBC01|nr:VQ motif-containing protein 8, chloroplastic-like [Vicia villosa]